ncbi:hypothetical protein HanXRQr2_Chr17g0803091 [Helianthus annuus]|uniref:Uncharacterized protein n=1 Tax=Helianthus annuus TaxID=4232 RepID=A0A251RRN7_HELAN|nr:uncharacterized protein LOC110922792 [Helianthus annuus]KAF5755465.1 hypothetical protein HanXRQr2_Chr17g0803091 [Helianthus annuus]KAJ0429186.1 hypothetical protein HanHA300_Chr17g0654481 [Helianthus annuus]KAJ0815622.1 hypothetical protein HanLR1_Chr00c0692g0767961 [Helianthus annuus]
MRDRGKSVESDQEYNNFNSDYNFYYSSSSSGVQCKKHPSSTQVGICAYCLKDRLMKLVCSECGEQRLSSCSCSDVSSYRNSSCTVDVGSVGRISFLIENEKAGSGDEQKTLFSHVKQSKKVETEDVFMLKRSNSCVVEVKKSNGFWRIGKLFKKKREKEGFRERNHPDWVSECGMDVSRCRSLCSYRGGNFDHDGGSVSDMRLSSAKISDFNESEPRKSGFRGGLMDFETGFSAKESEFSRIHDDSSFIDLKLDLSDRSKTDYSVFKNPSDVGGCAGAGDGGSSSCRITINERGIKKGSKGHSKVWKWIFKQKKDLHHILES